MYEGTLGREASAVAKPYGNWMAKIVVWTLLVVPSHTAETNSHETSSLVKSYARGDADVEGTAVASLLVSSSVTYVYYRSIYCITKHEDGMSAVSW